MANLGTLFMVLRIRRLVFGFLHAEESADHSQVIDLFMLVPGTGGTSKLRQKISQIRFQSVAGRQKPQNPETRLFKEGGIFRGAESVASLTVSLIELFSEGSILAQQELERFGKVVVITEVHLMIAERAGF